MLTANIFVQIELWSFRLPQIGICSDLNCREARWCCTSLWQCINRQRVSRQLYPVLQYLSGSAEFSRAQGRCQVLCCCTRLHSTGIFIL